MCMHFCLIDVSGWHAPGWASLFFIQFLSWFERANGLFSQVSGFDPTVEIMRSVHYVTHLHDAYWKRRRITSRSWTWLRPQLAYLQAYKQPSPDFNSLYKPLLSLVNADFWLDLQIMHFDRTSGYSFSQFTSIGHLVMLSNNILLPGTYSYTFKVTTSTKDFWSDVQLVYLYRTIC
jgi:hypothetical protein